MVRRQQALQPDDVGAGAAPRQRDLDGGVEQLSEANGNGSTGGTAESGVGGVGGVGLANASGTNAGPDQVNVSAYGNGGFGGNTALGGTGSAAATGASTGGGYVGVTATAIAGGNSVSTTPNNTASATASGTTTLGGSTYAVASGRGTGGTYNASGSTTSTTGSVKLAKSSSSGAVDSVGSGTSRSSIGQTSYVFGNLGNEATSSFIVGNPADSDVASMYNEASNLASAFSNNTALARGLGLVGLKYPAFGIDGTPNTGTGASHIYSTVSELTLNGSQLTNNDRLILGFDTAPLQGAGLSGGESLRLRVQKGSTTVVDQTFTTNAALAAYFVNHTVDLGLARTGLAAGADLDVQVLFDLTSHSMGNGFSTNFLLGDVGGFSIWNNAGGGSWATAGNWQNSIVPNAAGAAASFDSVITTPRTITLDGNRTVGQITFNNQNSYNIAQGTGGALTLDNGSDMATVKVLSGSHTISAPIALTANGAAFIPSGGYTLTLSGTISGNGGVTVTGPGTVIMSGTGSYTGVTAINGATLRARPAAYTNLLNNSSGTGMSGTGSSMLVLDYTGTGSPVAQVKSILTAGYAEPTKFLTGHIRSETLGANQTIGYGDNGAGLVTIRITLPGDANLDGTVNFNDFLVLQNNFNQPNTRFDQGNFNYDGVTNFNDFLVLQNNFGQSITGEPVTVTKQQVAAMSAFATANAIPEPTSFGVLGLGAAVGLRRRRRRD